MKYLFIKLFILLMAATSMASTNMCRTIFAPELTGKLAEEWHQVDTQTSARSLIGGKEINAYINQSIEQAQLSIEIQTLKLSPDIADMLIKKAQQGVKVAVQLTNVLELNAPTERKNASLQTIENLRKAGIQVDQYDTASLKRHTKIPSPDMHKKLLIVDGKTAYVGNKNFNQYDQSLEFGLALKGEVATALRSHFYKDLMHSQKNLEYLNEVVDAAASSEIHIYGTHELKANLIKTIKEAKSSITLAQVEFNDTQVVSSLIQAKKSNPGLVVRIMTGKNAKTYDVGPWSFQRRMNVDVIAALKKENIEIYEVEMQQGEQTFFHGKVSIIDGERIIIGSSDYNRRSLEGNAELDVMVRAPLLAAEFESFVLKNRSANSYATNFTKKELRTAKYYKLVTDLVIKLNHVKRLTTDKIRISPEQLKLTVQRNFGVLLRWIGKFGFSFKANGVRDFAEVTTVLKDRLVSVQRLDADAVLQPGESLVFLGSTPYYAETSIKFGLHETKNGRYGDGYYLATHFQAALEYSQLRIKQTSKIPQDLHVLVYKVKDLELLLDNNEGFIVEAALGLGQDYLVMQSMQKVKPFALIKVRAE